MSDVEFDTLVAAHGLRCNYPLRFARKAAAISTSYWLHSFWQSTGLGGDAGSLPTLGAANGRACDKSTPGALQYPDAPVGKRWFLHSPQIMSIDGIGIYSIMDKMADVQLVTSASSGAITGCDASARLAAGEGGQLVAEVSANFSAGANTFTLGYINQAGNPATTPTLSTFASTAQCRSISNTYFYLPLANGDTGARSITSLNWISGTMTGNSLFSIVRRVFSTGSFNRTYQNERDLFLEYPAAPLITNDMCLFFNRTNNSAAATMDHLGGVLHLLALAPP